MGGAGKPFPVNHFSRARTTGPASSSLGIHLAESRRTTGVMPRINSRTAGLGDLRQLTMARELSARVRYGAAVLITALASLVPVLLHPDLGDLRLPLVALVPAIFLSAWLGGFGPGMVSTAISMVVAGIVWALPGVRLEHLSVHDWLALGLLAALGGLLSALHGVLHTALRDTRRSATRAECEAAERLEAEHALRARVRQQAAVAELSQRALAGTRPADLMNEAVALLRDTLAVDYSKILELLPDRRQLLMRAGLGWKPGTVGVATVGTGIDSQAGYTLLLGNEEPLIVDDLTCETRFRAAPLMCDHGIVSGMSAVIPGPHGPFGVLGVHSRSRRAFTRDDANFVQAVANILASAIAREHVERERDDSLADARQANRLKDEFLATLSHEIRTPLNAILGWASLVRSGKVSGERQTQALDAILRNAQIQAQLVSDILDVSRIITGKLRLDLEDLEIAAVVDGVVESLQPAACAKDIRLTHRCDRRDTRVVADRVRMQQIVWNLVSNAIKFTPAGGRVSIDVRTTDSVLDLVVSDCGAGIPPDFLPHVFDRFRQADSSTTRQHGGLGLGLAIVRHLVELHGGAVSAASDGEGCGATFTVRLPVTPRTPRGWATVTERVTDDPAPARLPDEPGMLNGLDVLIVDDDADAREMLRTIFEQAGARPTLAASPSEAVALFRRHAPNLLVSSVGMPGNDGCVLMREIRSLPECQGGRVTAVAVTAYASATDRERALAAGFDLFFVKPLLAGEFLGAMAVLTGRA
jgi:signal transduction histidine kinase